MQRRRQVFLNGVNVVLCGNEVAFHGATIAWGTKVEKEHAMVSLPRSAAVWAARRRCVHLPEHHVGQHQRTVDPGRCAGGGDHCRERRLDPTRHAGPDPG